MAKKKFKAIVSGGGTRGSVMAGAFQFFYDQGWEVEEGVGISAGALFLSALASGRTPREVKELQKDFLPSDVLDERILFFWPFAKGDAGFFKGNIILDQLRKNVPVDYKHCVFPLHIGTHNWTERRQQVWSKGDLPLHVRASMSLPIFDMVRIDGDLHEDGGVAGSFLMDFEDWKVKSDAPVVGFSFDYSVRTERKPPENKVERLLGTVDDMLLALDRSHVDDGLVYGHRHVVMESSYGSMDLDMDEEDAEKMFQEGYESAQRWWEDNGGLCR